MDGIVEAALRQQEQSDLVGTIEGLVNAPERDVAFSGTADDEKAVLGVQRGLWPSAAPQPQ